MGLFGFGKKDRVVDLAERYKQQQKEADTKKESQDSSENAFGFLGGLASAGPSSDTSSNTESESAEIESDDKRKKLAKRLMDITSKLEDLNNQIYHLQQRIEVLERKAGVGGY